MNKSEILLCLRKVIPNVDFPSSIDFNLNRLGLLSVGIKFPDRNMQFNESAFESWIVAIYANIGKELDILSVELSLSDNPNINKCCTHYKRFLWRVYNFQTMYTWFQPDNQLDIEVKKFILDFSDVCLNLPSKDRGAVTNSKGERFVESLFVKNIELIKLLNCKKILNQFPVGVFKGSVKTSSMIFSGKGSAIDLIGIEGENIIHLIELKKGLNYGIGIISEYLFYSFILHGVFVSHSISYCDSLKAESFIDLFKSQVVEIKGHFLAEKFHPLLNDKTMNLINSGLRKYVTSTDRILYNYDDVNQVISDIRYI